MDDDRQYFNIFEMKDGVREGQSVYVSVHIQANSLLALMDEDEVARLAVNSVDSLLAGHAHFVRGATTIPGFPMEVHLLARDQPGVLFLFAFISYITVVLNDRDDIFNKILFVVHSDIDKETIIKNLTGKYDEDIYKKIIVDNRKFFAMFNEDGDIESYQLHDHYITDKVELKI